MEQKKNLCAQVPLSLHAQVCEAREAAGQTTSEYITNLLIKYYNLKKNGGTATMSGNTRTMAFQIPEELFQRIKVYLERETQRTGRKLTQREFVLNLIEEALIGVEAKSATSFPPQAETAFAPSPLLFPTGPAALVSGGNPGRLPLRKPSGSTPPWPAPAPPGPPPRRMIPRRTCPRRSPETPCHRPAGVRCFSLMAVEKIPLPIGFPN